MIDIDARNDVRQVALRGALLATLGMAALASVNPGPLPAQVTRAPAAAARPQPRFTRIFGSDSMDMSDPALSPDGRWVVFIRQQGSDTSNLWVVPASGGAPSQLTSGRYRDTDPRWFPAGDRIAFRSDRPSPSGEVHYYVMTLPFDVQTGRSAGPAQQVSLEFAGHPAVSPDGRWIAFFAVGEAPGTGRLVVVPSTGGTARTVFQARIDRSSVYASAVLPEWSPDGREIYFVAGLRGSSERAVMRVSAEGGEPERLWSTSRRIPRLNTAARQVLTLPASTPLPSTPVAQVSTFEGRPVASVPLHRNMYALSFTGDGRSVLAVVSDVVAPIRVVPVGGGRSRTLTQAREYDWPDSWSADGMRLSVQTRTNGHEMLLDLPIDGGPGVEITPPPEASPRAMLTRDRRHLIYVVADSATSRKSLLVRRLSDGRTREIARDLVADKSAFIAGPGGSPFSGEEGLYVERRGGRLELRACAPEGEPRLLRSFPASSADRSGFGVHGERIAWTEDVGDSSALVVAEGRNGTPRRVAMVRGRLLEPVWSPDGRWIAAYYRPPSASQPYALFVVGVTPGGQPSAPPRLVEAGPLWGWGINWLPDNRAVTVIGMSGEGYTTDIWLVSLREGDRPVNLTRDDPSMMWGYSLSPDGRYIAYPAEIPRGSSIWRIDLQP